MLEGESKALRKAEETLQGATKAELETLRRVGGKVKSTATSVGLAMIMIGVGAADGLASNKGTREWYKETHNTLNTVASGRVASDQQMGNIYGGNVYNNALWQLSLSVGETGGMEGGAGGFGTYLGFQKLAYDINNVAVPANNANRAEAKQGASR